MRKSIWIVAAAFGLAVCRGGEPSAGEEASLPVEEGLLQEEAAELPGEEPLSAEEERLEEGEGQPEGPLRDPFWPVGYVPRVRDEQAAPGVLGGRPAPGDPPSESEWEAAAALLIVDGFLQMGGADWARINRQIVQAGDVVTVAHGGRLYQWTVLSVTRDHAEFQPLTAEPLNR